MGNEVKLMIVAGEASGDGHAARLVQALRKGFPDTEFAVFGSAGSAMKEEGVEAIVDAERLAIIGGLEIVRELPMFLRAYGDLKAAAIDRRPDAVILVDFPDFNLRLARSLKKKGLRIIYFISPQVWAWKKYRVRMIRRYVDLMISILPFEKAFYEQEGFDRVEYVGSPVAAEVRPETGRSQFRLKYRIDENAPLVALLSGSRKVELEMILPDMLLAAKLVAERLPEVRFAVPLARARSIEELRQAAASAGLDYAWIEKSFTVVTGETYDAIAASDAAAVASGTATLETAVLGTPLVVVYKASALNYFLLRPLISIDTFGLVNLVAGKRLAVELIQHDLSPSRLADEILKLIEPEANRKMRGELETVKEALSGENASNKAAKLIMAEVAKGRRSGDH
jgi:lipid-A-disaccharide synthase